MINKECGIVNLTLHETARLTYFLRVRNFHSLEKEIEAPRRLKEKLKTTGPRENWLKLCETRIVLKDQFTTASIRLNVSITSKSTAIIIMPILSMFIVVY